MNKAALERIVRWYEMYQNGMSLQEIADNFGMSRQNISKQFSDARKQCNGGFEMRKSDETSLNREMALHYIRQYAREHNGAMPTLKLIAEHLFNDGRLVAHVNNRLINPLIESGELVKVKGGKWQRGYALPEWEKE